jgi:hypothetical protein
MNKEPEGYFCPKCNTKMIQEMVGRMLHNESHPEHNLPTLSVVLMGVDILRSAGCPGELVKPVYEWARAYGKDKYELNEVEKDKLKLLKWEEWAKS